MLARTDGRGRIAAGAIIFDSSSVAGLTNVFGVPEGLFEAVTHWTALETLVAYMPGVSAEESTRRGFGLLGSLTVWKRAGTKGV